MAKSIDTSNNTSILSMGDVAPDTIDLTSDTELPIAATVTPERACKRVRTSPRLEAQDGVTRKCKRKSSKDDDVNGGEVAMMLEKEDEGKYFPIDEVIDRRVRKYDSSGTRHIVEYLVSWVIPENYTGDEDYYKPSWLTAENLDQHSLMAAFRKFPVDADPVRSDTDKVQNLENGNNGEILEDIEIDDFSDDEEEESEDEEIEDGASDDIQEYDEGGKGELKDAKTKDPDVSQLEESDYDAAGTAELEVNRRTYRVNQSYYGPDENIIYTISVIQPSQRKAKCYKYMRTSKTFVCPKGEEDSYVLVSDGAVLDLASLKVPCRDTFKKYHMRYEQEDENQRSFAYFNETGKILHDPFGKPTVLDLFAGAGGMSLGLEKYFDVKWVVDNDAMAAATLQANKTNQNVQIYTEDVKAFLKNCAQGNPCYPKAGQVQHLHGSPPCKGFSRANRNGGKDDLMNNKQTLLFIKAIKLLRPKTASFENVPGLVLQDFKGYLQSVVSNLLQLGYQVRVKVLSSEKYGDPQKRRRLILLAARSDCKLPDMPPPTHGPGLLPIMTCKDALQMFEKEQPTLVYKSSGAVFINGTVVFNHLMPGRKPGISDDYELIEDEPSRTILARSRPYLHYNGGRFISVREAACLQSFPITYRFFGSLVQQYAQVGNAVSVKLATAIARSVAVVHGCAV